VARKDKNETEIAAPKVRGRVPLALFGPPLLLEGEDAAAYDQLLVQICAAVEPVDVIDEMFIADIVSLEWEVLRWRRLKSSLIRARGLEALEKFLARELDYDLYSERFADELTKILRDNFPDDQVEDAQTLAGECARNEPDADDRVNELLASIGMDMDEILDLAKGRRAKELVQEYVRREPDALTLVNQLLTSAGKSMDGLTADALAERLDAIERIDRLTTIAESRRNVSLREIDRRRAVLGEALRRSVQEIEDGEFEVIETTSAKGTNGLDERPQDNG
jgi:hypothetical protein